MINLCPSCKTNKIQEYDDCPDQAYHDNIKEIRVNLCIESIRLAGIALDSGQKDICHLLMSNVYAVMSDQAMQVAFMVQSSSKSMGFEKCQHPKVTAEARIIIDRLMKDSGGPLGLFGDIIRKIMEGRSRD
jgi:hypothetical protein